MATMRRVLHLRSSGGILGAEQVVLSLCRGSREFGYEAVLAVPRDAGDPVPRLYSVAKEAGIEAHLLQCRHRFDLGAVRQLRALLSAERIDVLHCHGYRENFYTAAASVAVPSVTTNHLWKRTTAALRFYAWVDSRLMRKFERVVAVSQEIHAELAAHGLRAPQLVYIPNGVDIDRYTVARQAGEPDRVVTLTAVGSLTPEKGHEYLLEAVAKLPDKTGLRVRIVGDGPCARDLRGRAHDLGVAEVVEFLGRRDDVPSLLAQSDIFVLPSLIEGLPIALLEAMAAGKACVATSVGDVARAVDHEATGLLVPSADSAALAAAIQRLVPDRGLRERLGEAARERVLDSFSSRRMVRDYCRLYDDLMPRR